MMGDVKKVRQRVFKYDNRTIAQAAGIPVRTVKEHRQRSLLNANSFRCVCLYVASMVNRRQAFSEGGQCDADQE